MPEGDTVHKIAARLSHLVGQTLERVTTQGLHRAISGKTVASVTAHGKHLVIGLDDGAYVRVHLGMYGRTRIFDPRSAQLGGPARSGPFARAAGEAALAKLSPGRVSLALVTSDGVYAWLGARTVEISDRRAPMRGVAVASLGPDVLADDFDCRQAASRAALHRSRTVAETLLDQRVASGIGNVYKSEVLFLCGIDPRTPPARLTEDDFVGLYTTARDVMIANLGPHMRATRERLSGDRAGDDRFFVYSRSGKPCRRCASMIECYQLGDPVRWTWSCPRCQSSGVNR